MGLGRLIVDVRDADRQRERQRRRAEHYPEQPLNRWET